MITSSKRWRALTTAPPRVGDLAFDLGVVVAQAVCDTALDGEAVKLRAVEPFTHTVGRYLEEYPTRYRGAVVDPATRRLARGHGRPPPARRFAGSLRRRKPAAMSSSVVSSSR
jgi:hypothetical protein